MLTDAEIQRALRIGMDAQLSDGNGKGRGRLVLIIRNKRASWYAQQWLAGKKRLKKIGNYPRLSLAEARKRYEAEYADVIESKQDIRIAESIQQGTLRDLFEGYATGIPRTLPIFQGIEYEDSFKFSALSACKVEHCKQEC